MTHARYQIHEVANIFPRMSPEEFTQLKADIKANGLRESIWIYEGKIIDGRNRYWACQEVGVEPTIREWDGNGSLVAFVVSLNLHRRHLDESQRGLIGGKIKPLFEEEARKRQGARTDLCANLHKSEPFHAKEQAAAAVNVSPRTVEYGSKVLELGAPELIAAVETGKVSVSAAATLAEAPKEEQAAIVACGEKEILQAAKNINAKKAMARRQKRMKKIAEISTGNRPIEGLGRFPIIYCDPPWRYEHIETESRAIENQYPTMALDEICALPVQDITTDDCILFLWATSPKLEESMRVLTSWGFTYRTCAVWDKEVIGMGYYFRQQHELLLVATKGSLPTPLPANRPSSVIRSRRDQHSAKPESVYELIEAMYPELQKLEMFCRSPRDGWSVWGNQSEVAA